MGNCTIERAVLDRKAKSVNKLERGGGNVYECYSIKN